MSQTKSVQDFKLVFSQIVEVLPNPSPRSVCTTKICFVNVRDVDTVAETFRDILKLLLSLMKVQ